MRFVRLLWITTIPGRAWVGSVSNKHNPSTESGLGACISSRITTVIHVRNDHQINYNCFNEPFAVSPYRSLYWDMHGLIFETSIWLLAGSTRLHGGGIIRPAPKSSPTIPARGLQKMRTLQHDKRLLLKSHRSSAKRFMITVCCNRSYNSHHKTLLGLHTITNSCCFAQLPCGASCHIVYRMRFHGLTSDDWPSNNAESTVECSRPTDYINRCGTRVRQQSSGFKSQNIQN